MKIGIAAISNSQTCLSLLNFPTGLKILWYRITPQGRQEEFCYKSQDFNKILIKVKH